MGNPFAIQARGRRAAAGLHRARLAVHGRFSRVHSSRYFGGLWFKPFSERGPC